MSKQTVFDKVDILGIEIDVVTMPEAITHVIALSAPGMPAGYVVKPYVEFLDLAFRDLEVQALLNDADLAIADGISLVWASAYLYAGPRSLQRLRQTLAQMVYRPAELMWPLTERAAGVTLTVPLLAAAQAAGRRVFLVGSPKHTTIERTARTIQTMYPQLKIVGTHHGDDEASDSRTQSRAWLGRLAHAVRAADADIILLGLGFPRQEIAASYLSAQLDHGIFIGEGGTFDYAVLGGARAKAPSWMQRASLEWLWRLIQEPTRLRRQLAIPRFMYRIWRSGRSTS